MAQNTLGATRRGALLGTNRNTSISFGVLLSFRRRVVTGSRRRQNALSDGKHHTRDISDSDGESLILLATVHILIFVSGLVVAGVLRHGAHFVTPFAPAEELRSFVALSLEAVRVSNFFLFGSAVPFGIFAVTTVSRLRFMGVRAAGTNIALLGGLIATIALILSGVVGWILSVPEVLASAQIVKAVTFLNFLLGGVVFAVGFGLLAAGVSVTCYFMRLLPRWLVAFGMFIAITGELSSFSLLAFPANFFIPITRYLGLIWMVSVAIALTRNRKGAAAKTGEPV